MAQAKTARKTNTAMVYNPVRKLTVGGASRSTNPVRKRKRRNPSTVKKVVNASSHRRRRPRRNPENIPGLIAAALVAGVGVSLFDILTTRFLPQGNALVRIGVKFGGAYLFQSNMGNKIPILNKYKKEIALVLAVSGVVDLFTIYALPVFNQVTGGFLMPPQQTVQMVPAGSAEELADDYYVVEEYEGDDDEEDEDY